MTTMSLHVNGNVRLGYGHLTCKTSAGKTVTIIYSMIGIPLMMLFIANIGASMAVSFRFVFTKLVRSRKVKKKNENSTKTLLHNVNRQKLSKSTKTTHSGQKSSNKKYKPTLVMKKANKFKKRSSSLHENSKKVRDALRRINTLIEAQKASGSFNNLIEINAENSIDMRLESLINLAKNKDSHSFLADGFDRLGSTQPGMKHFLDNYYAAACNDNVTEDLYNLKPYTERRSLKRSSTYNERSVTRSAAFTKAMFLTLPNKRTESFENPQKISLKHIPSYIERRHRNKQPDNDEKAVPLVLISLIIALYFIGGATLFACWEENWSFLNSLYFCFVTLTTIGFGDLVPGHTLNAAKSKFKFMIATCYIVLGLVLIAMCIDLVKERINQNIKNFVWKIGIRKSFSSYH